MVKIHVLASLLEQAPVVGQRSGAAAAPCQSLSRFRIFSVVHPYPVDPDGWAGFPALNAGGRGVNAVGIQKGQ